MRFTYVPDALCTRLPGITLALLLALGTPLQANERMDAAEACIAHESRIDRLACYDAVFMSKGDASLETDATRPALWRAIEEQERSRETNDMGLMVRQHADDVFMSVPALGSVPPRPLLILACENSITHFQLHLPQAVEATRVSLTLDTGSRSLEQTWRIRDGGHVIGGGRGLPAIATLRELLGAATLTLHSDMATLDGLRFDLTGLRDRLRPLRDACRW